ncbi:phosphatase PAP2 family protein [Oryzomonas japonica]|uniref:Phosphatase PAP2 family protein n=1 Tax=Oryzomonas japonica TaxID=2603858 RepID=A0A7J4ZP14_9BACT|nr:phosphatase PAP2 family protein [Oryzomonas japonica]
MIQSSEEGRVPEPVKPDRFIDSVNCAIAGIIHAARTEKHMRNHFISAGVVLLVALFLKVNPLEFALLALSILFVLFAELINTAVEAVVDLVSPGYNHLAKIAKDTAAGAVLVAACGAAIMGYLILAKYILPLYGEVLAMFGAPSDIGTMVSILIVTIVVIMLKGMLGKGSPLHGGAPSGHAAIAFSIATAASLNSRDPLTSLLSVALALMVSHSRLFMRIHTMGEVVAGSCLGAGLTFIVLYVFKFLGS